MKLGIRRVPSTRWPHPPIWSVALVGGWGLLVGVSTWLEARTGVEAPTCLLKRISGHPCPTCGSTRAVLALGAGRWAEAFAWNPLVMGGLGITILLLLDRLVTASRPEIVLDAGGRRLLWALGIGAFLANWVWVWPRN